MPPIMFFSNFPMSYAKWASTPMLYSQCNCNNGNNSWMNWWMMSEMVKNIGQMFRKPEKQPPIPYAYNPYLQYTQPYQTMYPYVNLNNTQQYPLTEQDEGLRELQEAYKNCKTKFNFVKVNDKYIAIDKNDKRIKADTAEELMDKIDEYIEKGKDNVEHEGDETADLKEEIESLREQIDELQAQKEALEKGNTNPNDNSNAIPEKWVGCGVKRPQTAELTKFLKDSIKEGMQSKDVAQALINRYSNEFNLDLKDVDVDKLADQLVTVNPDIFEDNKIKEGFDIKKFTFPAYDYFASVAKSNLADRNTKFTIESGKGNYNGSSKNGKCIKAGTEQVGFMCCDTGFGWDAVLSVMAGDYKNQCFKFVCDDNDNLNFDKFKFENGRVKIKGDYTVKALKNINDNTEISVTTDTNGFMNVKIDDKEMTLEEFMQYKKS